MRSKGSPAKEGQTDYVDVAAGTSFLATPTYLLSALGGQFSIERDGEGAVEAVALELQVDAQSAQVLIDAEFAPPLDRAQALNGLPCILQLRMDRLCLLMQQEALEQVQEPHEILQIEGRGAFPMCYDLSSYIFVQTRQQEPS